MAIQDLSIFLVVLMNWASANSEPRLKIRLITKIEVNKIDNFSFLKD